MKIKYIMQSLLLGPAVMLFDYQKYKKKIWITFILSILSFGLAYFLVFWPLVVIIAIIKPVPKIDKKHSPFNKNSSIKSKPLIALLVLTFICYTAFYLFVFYTVAYFITYVGFGEPTSPIEKNSYALWTLLWFSIIVIPVLLISLSKIASKFSKILYSVFILGVVVVYSINMVWVRSNTKEIKYSTSCDISSTLNNAINATLPISTDKGLGTGFAVDNNGSVVTAYHVVKDASEVSINLSSGKISAQVVRVAPEHDLALIKTELGSTPSINLTTSYKVAQDVYAIGWPGNTYSAGKSTITKGIVSRIIDTEGDFKLLQTDAAVNPGNSGGPLVSACGAVGVVLAKSDTLMLQDYGISSEEGISYAVSSDTIKMALGL